MTGEYLQIEEIALEALEKLTLLLKIIIKPRTLLPIMGKIKSKMISKSESHLPETRKESIYLTKNIIFKLSMNLMKPLTLRIT